MSLLIKPIIGTFLLSQINGAKLTKNNFPAPQITPKSQIEKLASRIENPGTSTYIEELERNSLFCPTKPNFGRQINQEQTFEVSPLSDAEWQSVKTEVGRNGEGVCANLPSGQNAEKRVTFEDLKNYPRNKEEGTFVGPKDIESWVDITQNTTNVLFEEDIREGIGLPANFNSLSLEKKKQVIEDLSKNPEYQYKVIINKADGAVDVIKVAPSLTWQESKK